MQNLYRTSAFLIIFVLAFSGCGPFVPFDPDPNDNPPPSYDSDNDWLCKPGVDDVCDYIPPNSGLIDNQATAEADCFAVHQTTMVMGMEWNAKPAYKGDFFPIEYTRGPFSAFNGTCRIYAPRYRGAHGGAFINRSPDRDSFLGALQLAYSDVERAFDYYLENYNEGRPLFLVGYSQGSWHLEELVRQRIEGTALSDSLVAAYLIGGWLRTNSFTEIPYCNDPQETGCVVGWNTVAESFIRGKEVFSIVDAYRYYWNPGTPHCTNPLSWTVGGGPVPASQNPGSVGFYGIEQFLDPGVVGASCREEDPNDPKAGLLEVEDLNLLQQLIFSYVPLTNDYHGADYGLFYMSIRQNAQDRLDSYLQ